MSKEEKVLVKSGKTKIKISDEERKKRSERMKALRERLKGLKQVKEEQEPEPEEEEAEEKKKEEQQTEEVAEEKPARKINKARNEMPAQAPPPCGLGHPTGGRTGDSKPKKAGVKKKISIKYYGDVSDFEMMNDNKMLSGLHNNDVEGTMRNKMLDANLKMKDEEKKFDEMRRMIYGN